MPRVRIHSIFSQALRDRYGDASGTRQLIEILWMHRDTDSNLVHEAVELAMSYGAFDAAAIAVLLRQIQMSGSEPLPLADLGVLVRFEREIEDLGDYNKLLRMLPPSSEEVH